MYGCEMVWERLTGSIEEPQVELTCFHKIGALDFGLVCEHVGEVAGKIAHK